MKSVRNMLYKVWVTIAAFVVVAFTGGAEPDIEQTDKNNKK